MKWFSDNQFQANVSKCHVLLSTAEHVQVKLGAAEIENSSSEKLLGVTIDAKLSFEKHIEQIYAKARAKLKALARIAPFMNIKKKKVLIKTFFMAQFSYCPLIWMFHSRKLWWMMKMMNCFCDMVGQRKAFSLISRRDHCQWSSPSRISDTPQAGFEPAQDLSSGLVEWSCTVVINTSPQRHKYIYRNW